MKDHYDICVAGFWYAYNYGSLLNGYAEYRLLKDMGKEVLMLQKPGAKEDDPEITSGHNTRFVIKHYDKDDISPALPYNRLEELNKICNCFCVGSDQTFNYNLSFNENMYLPFAHDDKRIISFASSFGHKNDNTPDAAKERIKSYFKRFHAISVREQFDADILKQNYGVSGTLLFEPVFCLEKKVYKEIAAESAIAENESYLLAYIVNPTQEKREAVLYYAKKSDMKAMVILDGYEPAREYNIQAMDLPNIQSDVGVEDFLKLYMGASFVVTDSFHGVAFSVIFNKSFLCIGNPERGIDCFVDLFDRLKITDRLISGSQNIPLDEKYLQQIDYTEANQIVEEEKRKTIEWLKWALETPLEDLPFINIKKVESIKTRAPRFINENGIVIIKNVYDYLEQLRVLEDAIVIISVKDTVGQYFNDELQKKMVQLGLKENLVEKFRVGYIAIINNRLPVFEEITEESGTLKYETKIEDIDISVTSLPLGSGNEATIRIDGIDYAINQRGLNIVSYDLKNHSLIDSVVFDTHEEELTCHRKISHLNDHYDIGVVGCWWGANYGSVLNGYAVYKTLKKLKPSILMIQKHNATQDDWEVVNTHSARFIEKFYPEDEVSPVIPFSKLNVLNDYCDTFVTGSDQIWNYEINKSFDMVFMLNFVDEEKRKLSFGTSFGHERNNTPKEILSKTKALLERYQAISVREKSGAEICRDTYGLKAKVICEPVFCLTVDEYCEISDESHIEIPTEPYILTYILDPTEEKRKAILEYMSITKMESISILDGDPRVFDKNKEKLDLPNIMENIGAEDFVCLYQNASFIMTDSFHGTAFALIFNKPFLSISNLRRGAIRFHELLHKFNLTERLAEDPSAIPVDKRFLESVNHAEINKKIEKIRADAILWLQMVIETPVEELPSIELPQKAVTTLLKKLECMGCGACVSVCPYAAISLQPDELGYYRSDIDYEKCVDCGKCALVCPSLQLPKTDNSETPACFAFVASDEQLLYNSSSGGIFPLLAEEAFKRDGRVAGAAWRDDFSVEHIFIEDKKDLHKLQKSKYLQSYLGKTFCEAKELLDNDVFVLFSGCPCQVAGLKKFLEKDYDNLILVDLLCSNSPSARFFQKYLADAFPRGIEEYQFRHKVSGWAADCVTVSITEAEVGTFVRRGGSEDAYQRVYHNHTMCPPHCEKCKYQRVPRFGDLTIGDFWGVSKKDSRLDVNGGVSVVLCNNGRGREFFDAIPDTLAKVKKEVPLQWLGENGYAINGSHNFCSPQRNSFYKAIRSMSFQKAANYALKPNHGEYPIVFKGSNTPLQFESSYTHFRFDSAVWEEHTINGMVYLMVKPGMSKRGRFAVMALCQLLDKDQEYSFGIRFRIKTNSKEINFHIKDSGTDYFQVIYSYRLNENYNPEEWIEIESKFKPKSNIYDEFMIGAAQVSGTDNYICFDYITIRSGNS